MTDTEVVVQVVEQAMGWPECIMYSVMTLATAYAVGQFIKSL